MYCHPVAVKEFIGIVSTPRSSNIKTVEARDAKEAAEMIASKARKSVDVRIVDSPIRARRLADGQVQVYSEDDMQQNDLFDGAESQRRKRAGMDAAAAKAKSVMKQAREVAKEICRRQGTVTADDVGQHLAALGIELGPASGGLFKTRDFVFTGERIRSTRIKNHGRELKVWKLAQ